MPSLKISQLTTGSPTLGGDLIRVARFNGINYDDWKYTIDDIKTYLNAVPISQKGAANGVAPLDSSSKVPVANLPFSAIAYKGTWNAATNTPTITSGSGTNGNFYWVTVAGNTNIDGISSWSVGQVIVFNGNTNKWERGTMGTGTPGPAGADGRTVLNGTVAPTSGVGLNGDFYINTATNQIYGPKASNTWPSPVSLVGPAGPSGSVAQGKMRYVTNQTEFQAALNGFNTGVVTKILMIQDVVLTSPLQIPKFPTGSRFKLEIDLCGNILSDGTATGLTYLIGRTVNNQSETNQMMFGDFCLHLYNGTLLGNASPSNQNPANITDALVDLACSYNSIFENLNIYAANIGIHLKFCLMSTIRSCNAVSIFNTAFIIDRGFWTGSEFWNSQSNHSLIENTRVYNRDGAFAAFHVRGCSGVIIRHCISEGWPYKPQHHVYWDYGSATTVKDGTIEAFHVETQATQAAIKIVNVHEGYFSAKGIFSAYHQTLIDATANSGPLRVYLENVPWWSPDPGNIYTQLKHTGNIKWSFKDITWPSGTNSRTPTYWVSGLPTYWEEQGYDFAGPVNSYYLRANAYKINNSNF